MPSFSYSNHAPRFGSSSYLPPPPTDCGDESLHPEPQELPKFGFTIHGHEQSAIQILDPDRIVSPWVARVRSPDAAVLRSRVGRPRVWAYSDSAQSGLK